MALRKADKKNFATLSRAFRNDHVALVDVLRLKDKKAVAGCVPFSTVATAPSS
jgi:hypothetical protein